ncbi:S9 family peptidase [Pseudoxanthomonas gei]|uniref:S9 family peptidase n=1 Tax=Pseudoxanthomonas gei TaxID=1383030 RepID=A0ABX0AI15_9GAMM|nr:S9 family peptidase [Pseudoxanthomonas gei]NDK40222.1 S9 family peptidase [Pseudoxanthomonas gei]
MRPCLHVLLSAAALVLVPTVAAQESPALSIEQVMADPDWIGPPVEGAWWAWDGKHVQYQLKRQDSAIRDTFQQSTSGAAAQRVGDRERDTLDAATPVYDGQRRHMAFVRNGDVFLRDLRSGALEQLTRSNDEESQPQFASDGGLVWRVANQWYRWTSTGGVVQAALVKAEKDPNAKPKPDALREQQLRTLQTLARDKAQRDALQAQNESWRKADPSRAAPPVYLGDDVQIVQSAMSPDARWLLVVTQKKNAESGQAGKLPRYVTESGYEEFQEVRTRVGRNAPPPQALWLADLANGSVRELKFDALPGIADDPLAALRKAAGKEALKGNRDVQVATSGDNGEGSTLRWSADSRNVAVMVRAIDNKDRWIAGVDLAEARLQPRHRLTDPAWINWSFNDFGWANDNRTLWFLSEQSGYSHLYTQREGGKPVQLTSGAWEASAPVPAVDGDGYFFLCNRKQPGRYEVCRVDGGKLRELTDLGGVEDFTLSPDGSQLLLHHSASYLPSQLSVIGANGGNAKSLTDTRTPAFKARQWIEPQMVQVPSRHGAGQVWAKYYGPATLEPGKHYPIVMFVHGAGYLQNVHARYPAYFREQMFHNLLVQRGYIVLDMDYRGSEGYGRDWRTAIYRNMGHPELDDYLDGLDWLVANKQGDRDRAGIYGGSYGGFMTFMALFREPGKFKAGAALRPVVDWTQYNHEYTSNILNTPELDPEAYRKSSPIEYAAGLQDHLLIAHGMVDDNVFFRDSVVLTQKLIELHKDNWEIAPYPLERHSFTRADSWLDEYKRVLKLFEENLK